MRLMLEERIRLLEGRLDRVEEKLGMEPPGKPSESNAPWDWEAPDAPERGRPGDGPAPVANIPEVPVAEPVSDPPILPPQLVMPPPLPKMDLRAAPELQPLKRESESAPPKVLPYVSPEPKIPTKQNALEQTIGLKWAGWVGAVVLLIGAALGVKYAYDQHWFAALPIWVWPTIIAACGFALIGAGEWVYRKVNVIPAASLFGAGVSTLFLVSYIGHSYYEIYSPDTAFILMSLTTIVGSAIAMRGRLVSIAVLSQIGGNIAPLIMGDSGAHFGFMTYLMMLQIIALTLAAWGQTPRWWMLRGLSLASTALWMSGIIAAHHDGLMPLWFAIAYAILYHVEVILSARRADRDPERVINLAHGGAVFVTLVTAGLTATILTVLSEAFPMTRALWLVGLAVACAIAAFSLRDKTRKLSSSLAPAYSACSAALLTLAVPVAFHGLSVEIGWATLAIAMAVVGRATRSKMSQAGAIATWTLALVHLLVTAPGTHAAIWLTIAGVPILSTTILAWGLAMVGHILASLLHDDASNSQPAGALLSAFATIVFGAATLLALPPMGATLCLIVYAWLMLGADVLLPQMRWAMHSIAVLLIATVKWIVLDTLAERLAPGWSAARYLPVVNPMMGIGLLLAGSLVAVYWLRRASLRRALPDAQQAPLTATLALAVAGLLAIGFTFEIDRVVERAILAQHALDWPAWQIKQLAWTMLWSASAVSLGFVISRMRALNESRIVWLSGIATICSLLVGKFILLDTLMFRLGSPVATAPVLLNLQSMTALMVLAATIGMRLLIGTASFTRIWMLALFVVGWTGTFEIERFAVLHSAIVAPWPTGQFIQMAWTMWWTTCTTSAFALARRYDRDAAPNSGWAHLLPGVILLLAGKFAIVDALFWRLTDHVTLAPVLANLQALTAAVVMGALILLMTLGLPGAGEFSRPLRVRAGFASAILALLAISLEIDRLFEGPVAAGWFTHAHLAKQVAFSIVWSVFAVASVAVGFRIRLASLRYFGLALLAVTLLKVVTIDLGQVSTGYRTLSFLGLGLLMMGTSVLYGKLSPMLLKPETADC